MGSTTHSGVFEALFERRLNPTGAFAEELKAAGYEPGSGVTNYPTEIWLRCLEIARRYTWPHLSAPEGHRRLGRTFLEGFFETLGGRIVGAAVPFMTPQTFVRNLGMYFRLGRDDAGLTFELTRDEPGASDLVVHNPAETPGEFVAGIIDAAVQRMKVTWTVDVDQRTPRDYTLWVRWK